MPFIKNKRGVFFVILCLTIIILLFGIILLNNKTSNVKNITGDPELNTLINKASMLQNDKTISQDNQYIAAIDLLKSLDNNKLSDLQQYRILAESAYKIQSLYINTNNPRIRKIFSQDIAEYAKKHYQKYYDKDFFQYPCQDPTCAQNTHSEKMSVIINDVKKTDFSDNIKQGIIHDLITAGYREENSKDDLNGKVNQYLNIARDIKNLTENTKNESNIKIYKEVQEFIKVEYPERYLYLKKLNSILIE